MATEKRLIDAHDLWSDIMMLPHNGDIISSTEVEQAIMDAPTANVAEAQHGHWFLLDECANAGVYCSVCHKKVYKEHYANQKLKSKYCPNCGACMKDGDWNG